MVRKYHFLSALMLVICLSASFFTPSKVNAYGISCWGGGCDELSEEDLKTSVKEYLDLTPDDAALQREEERLLRIYSGGNDYFGYNSSPSMGSTYEYYQSDFYKAKQRREEVKFYNQLGKTNCEQCAKNVSKINDYMQKNWQAMCREANDFNTLSAAEQESTMARCETLRKQMAEETARELACADQEAKNVYGMSGAIVAGGVAALSGTAAVGAGVLAAGVALGIATAPVSVPVLVAAAVVTGAVAVVASVGAWLFGRQVDSEAETFGAKFTEVLNNFMGEDSGCWFCSSFDLLFHNINKMATHMYTELRSLFLALLAIFTMGWLLWTVFKFITTIHGPNVGELMTKLFKGLGAALLIAIVLRASPSFITGYIIDPFAIAGSELSGTILRSEGIEVGTVEYTVYSLKEGGYHCGSITLAPDVTVQEATTQTETKTLCRTIKETDSDYKELFEGKALSASVYSMLSCLLRSISAELIFGLALGATLISEGIRGGFGSVLPQFDVLTVGVIVFLAYFLLFIKVPFKLIDLLLRLAFVVVLLPLFIVCMVTPATRGYSKKAWDMLLGCWISLIALCLSVALTITLMGDTLMRDLGGE